MIVKFKDIINNIEKYHSQKSFLFHGPNFGKIHDIQENVISQKKKYAKDLEIVNIYSDDLKKGDFLKISKKLSEPNLFGSTTVLIISLNNERINKEITSYIDQIEKNCILIIKSNQLGPKSSLRTFFEKSKSHIIVPCYEETDQEKNQLISSCFKKEGIMVSENEVMSISNVISNERFEIKNEVQKLILVLKSSKSKKNIMEMLSFLSESTEVDTTRFIHSIFSGKKNSFTKDYNKVSDFGTENIRLLNSILDHLYKILEVKEKMKTGISSYQAIASLKPPVFFKYSDSFKKQVAIFKTNELYQMIGQLYSCRKSILKGHLSCHYFFLITLVGFFYLKNS